MAAKPGITIEGLTEFRAALKSASAAASRELTAGLKRGGEPIIRRASSGMPSGAGPLSASVRGSKGSIVSKSEYGGGAEWGRMGWHRKWTGWTSHFGAPPRFVSPALDSEADEVMRVISEELREIITANGWCKE